MSIPSNLMSYYNVIVLDKIM